MTNAIEFQLLAPYNKKATLTGSFSDWQEIPMEKDKKGYFRTSVDLEDGVYQYKFRVQSKSWFNKPDEWVEINDPYVTEIDLDTGNGVIRIDDGKRIVDSYIWQHDDKPLPPTHQLVIYELLVSDFYDNQANSHRQGQYKNIIEKLDYLNELGINAIELLPINETPGDYNWGYVPSYFFAPQPLYGSTADLKRLIDECHARGIRVILDQLYNHSSDESPLLQIDRDYWYYHDRHYPEDADNHWGPEFNYSHYDENRDACPAWDFMGDVVRFWIREYHIDGIRYDAIKQINNPNLLHWITEEAKKTASGKPFYNIGEYIPDTPEIVKPNGALDGCWRASFYYNLQPHLCDGSFNLEEVKQALDAKQQGYPADVIRTINYLSSHDQVHLLSDLGDNEVFDDAAFKRAKLGAVLLMTAIGVPMLWMGEEFGEYKVINADQKKQTLTWSLLKNERNRNLWEYYKGLIVLRKQNQALFTANIEFFHENPEGKVFAYVRWNDEGSRVVVVANFSDSYLKDYSIPNFPVNGTWHEWTQDYDIEVKDNRLTTSIGEYEAQVFVCQ